MSLYGSSVEYGLHCLLYLVDTPLENSPSSKDLAEFQGISPTYVAKIFTQLEKAGIVESAEGIRGGFRLAKPADRISVLEVADAIEGHKALFQCREIRIKCTLFEGNPPKWSTRGVCGIHAVMLEGEKRMREALASYSLADVAGGVERIIPAAFFEKTNDWFNDRSARRIRSPKQSKNM